MKTSMENKLSMYEAVIEVLDMYSAEVATVPALVVAKSDVVNLTVAIRAANLIQQKTTVGKTTDKGERKLELADTAHWIAGAVQAYASVIGNNDLYMLVNFSRTRLRKADDEEIQQLCQLIHDEANGVMAALGDYGVAATDLAALQLLIDGWNSSSQAPRVAISERVAATRSLPDLFSDADDVVKKRMDKLMEQFRLPNRIFYDTYKAARKIVNSGHGSGTVPSDMIEIGIYMYDGITFIPIQGGVFRVLNPPTGGPVEVITDAQGLAAVKINGYAPNMTVSVDMEVWADNYQMQTGQLDMLPGNRYSLDVPMDPIVP